MTTYVLDASVAAKWYLPAEGETHKQAALALLEGYMSGSIDLVVPDVFWTECGNIFWKAVRRGRISQRTAEDSLAGLVSFDLATAGSKGLLREAFGVASECDRTVYDAVYVALASAWVRSNFGQKGVYVLAAITGTTLTTWSSIATVSTAIGSAITGIVTLIVIITK